MSKSTGKPLLKVSRMEWQAQYKEISLAANVRVAAFCIAEHLVIISRNLVKEYRHTYEMLAYRLE